MIVNIGACIVNRLIILIIFQCLTVDRLSAHYPHLSTTFAVLGDAVAGIAGERDWKPMTAIGPGVREIRIHTDREHRLIYVAKFAEAVYVLHAFTKKSRSTAQRDIDIASIRYRQVVESRGKP